MTPLTPEQVEKLRLPEGYEIVDDPVDDYNPYSLEYEDDPCPSTDSSIANCAIAVANGHLPPAALDDVWRRVDGKPSREAELLRAVVQADNLVYATMAAMVLSHGDHPVVVKATAKRFDDATKALRESIEAARKWIEEQSK